jgi:hypothetical protein
VHNLTVHTAPEGTIWLEFTSSSGKKAWINIDVLATDLQSETAAAALAEWCEDRRRGAAFRAQPANDGGKS